MSRFVDSQDVSTSMGQFKAHILVDVTTEWLWDPYTVLIEPNKNIDHLYIFQHSLYDLGPTPVVEDIGECEFCGSKQDVSPCFKTNERFDVQSKDLEDHFWNNHAPLCVNCLLEFERFVMETVPEEYSEYILLGQV